MHPIVQHGTNYWASLPTLTQIVPFTSMFTLLQTIIDGKVMSLFLTDQIQREGIVYTGILMALTMCFVAAAYVATQTVDAGVNLAAWAHVYRGGSLTWGDNLGLFELIGILLFSGWSFVLTIMGLYGAATIWASVDARKYESLTEGKYGDAFDLIQAMKYFVLCMIVGLTTLIGAFSLGGEANHLITWFDEYADETKKEGDEKTDPSKVDPNGTSAMYDITYHYATLAMSYMLFTVIVMGGHMFGMHFMRYADQIECDMNLYDESTKSELLSLFGTLTSSLEKCYETMPTMMAKLDVNHNKMIDRCEDANLLRIIAPSNTEEYAIKFSHNQPTITAYQRCDELFNPLW